MARRSEPVIPFEKLGIEDVARVGGKNASLGEMLRHLGQAGIRVPGGFATTADAYRRFLQHNDLEGRIRELLEHFHGGTRSLGLAARSIRNLILKGDFPDDLARGIREQYRELASRSGLAEPAVAVRSSATAEDLPEASFAGQQETYLNIRGEDAVLDACRRCFASLFTDRAIVYRETHGFDHMAVALSAGVQFMVRADSGGAGVMFSIDTETGFDRTVLINAAWGLGETVVQGSVDPDEYVVFKPLLKNAQLRPVIKKRCGEKAKKLVYSHGGRRTTHLKRTGREERDRFVLTDEQILQLASWAVTIEAHYGMPMDMEWALDGETGELFMLQARPETVQSRHAAIKTFTLGKKGELLVSGHAIGEAIATGPVRKLNSPADGDRFQDGAILVTSRTDPDWISLMKRASAIVTDHGGRTSHAAIVSRELGLPAIVGTGNGTTALLNGQDVTVSCAEGETGHVYAGTAEYTVEEVSLDDIPVTRTQIMLNLADPDAALRWWRLPADGVGLARIEFIINRYIRVHPMALVHPEKLSAEDRRSVGRITRGWPDPTQYFIDQLALGIAPIAASRYPAPVIVRMSDFKTDEYANLIGGRGFEPEEANPMLGWRGASRYYSDDYREGFALECRAIRKVREEIGLDNVIVMIPFCRTVGEADLVLKEMAHNGLRRGAAGLQVYVMCEIPSNVILAERFAERFDGFSIGSNDLTQLTLGIDRDSTRLAELFNEQDEAVTTLIATLIERAHKHGCKVGLCGQAPSDRPGFARFLVEAGIDSISVNPDSFLVVKREVADPEKGAHDKVARMNRHRRKTSR